MILSIVVAENFPRVRLVNHFLYHNIQNKRMKRKLILHLLELNLSAILLFYLKKLYPDLVVLSSSFVTTSYAGFSSCLLSVI